jgi:hypothetical protein
MKISPHPTTPNHKTNKAMQLANQKVKHHYLAEIEE